MSLDLSDVSIRAALPSEAALVVAHRRVMFAEIRQLPTSRLDVMDAAFGPRVAERLARGDYHGWFGVTAAGEAVGGAGVWLMDWCQQNQVRMVILHASDAGRPNYQSLGSTATNEMSLMLDVG
jgi:hypothetical protein